MYLWNCLFFAFAILLLDQFSLPKVEGARCSPINRYVSLSKKEEFCFQLSPDGSNNQTEQLDVQFLGIKSHYFVPQMYTFYPPNVSVICECSCDVSSGTCSQSTYYKHDKCARHKSDTSVCTLLYKDGTDGSICTDSVYKMCCQVYFSVPDAKESKYYGLYINKHENTMEILLSINITSNGRERKSSVFRIPNHVRRLQFDNDSLITLSVISPSEALPDDWYYVQDGNNNLMTGIFVNKIGDQDLRKLGWFQKGLFGPDGKEELLSFDSTLLDQYLRIQPKQCQTKNPLYDWEFHAKYYNKQGSPPTQIVGKPAMQVHGRFISNISVDLNKKSVIVDHRNPPELKLLVTKSEPVMGDLIFNGTILRDAENNFILRMIFSSGKKITYLINVGIVQEGSEDFYFTVYKSQQFPVEHSFRLINKVAFPTWVCIYEESESQKQLCQMVDLSDETYEEGTPQADNYQIQVAGESDSGYLKSLVILTLCIAILSLLINAIVVYVYCMRRRRKQGPMRSSNSFEKIRKDLKKEDRTEPDGNRYSHLYEYLRPANAAQPVSSSSDNHEV